MRLFAASVVALLQAGSGPQTRADLFKRLEPSVVVLEATSAAGDRLAHGTGFVVRADGLVVTNHHVIDGFASMRAVFADGRRHAVTGVVFSEPKSDLAVVQLDARGLTPLVLGRSEGLAEGASIFVLGNPLGLDFSFAEGVVAAVRESGLPGDSRLELKDADRQPLLQLDVNSDFGGSGSPVVDAEGRVVGVLASKLGRALFAVPVDTLSALLATHPLDEPPRPLKQVPWVNLAISVVVLVVTAVWVSGWRRGGRQPRARRRFTGYEE
ncbi:MAG: trypsin-like peptidase domain-containing protein [Myxococcaceae bacterium]|jgi:serine protease Do|nr:trypsin-like peptidase domain-containing protein [Myxococcaceae bacterium]MCA3011880.1 trypsin-like peptidase domain-containing protein [Myxococcaceae bacterium]